MSLADSQQNKLRGLDLTSAHLDHLKAGNFQCINLRLSGVGHFHFGGRVGDKDADILLDTGAASTVVDRDWAQDCRFRLRPIAGKGAGAGAAAIDLAVIENAALVVGGTIISEATLVAIDMSHVREGLRLKGVEPPQVILGVDVLQRWRAVIDYGSRTLWLAPKPMTG